MRLLNADDMAHKQGRALPAKPRRYVKADGSVIVEHFTPVPRGSQPRRIQPAIAELPESILWRRGDKRRFARAYRKAEVLARRAA